MLECCCVITYITMVWGDGKGDYMHFHVGMIIADLFFDLC